MYRKVKYRKSTIKSVPVFEGERIEEKVERILNNKEPISDGAPINYTARGEINPNYDHRTDRWEVAADNMEIVHKTETAKVDVNPNIQTDDSGNNDIANSDSSPNSAGENN